MKSIRSIMVSAFLIGSLGMSFAPAFGQGVVFKLALSPGSNICHMKFRPIREDTLGWDHPVLAPAGTSLIDYYGSCDHDPLGKDEIQVQRDEVWNYDFSDE
ncbi:MAG: hypothetical protein ACE5HC_13710 [Candidatus Binatia bacterium]